MNPLEHLVQAEIAVLSLEFARIVGVVATSPIPWLGAPVRVRAGLVMLLVLVVHGQSLHASVPEITPAGAALSILSEFIAGAAMGMVVRMLVATAEMAGNSVAPVIGFGTAQLFDPATGATDSVLGRGFRYLVILLALASGLHRVLLGSLMASFQAVPVGTISHPELSAPMMIEITSNVLVMGVRLALPILAVLLMIQIALGFVSRAAPAMQIFNIGFAVLLAVGAVVMIMALPDIGGQLLVMMSHVGTRIEHLLVVMSGG